MQSSVVVWQRGALRIVAIDGQEKDERPMLVLERRYLDALDNEAWRIVLPAEEDHGMIFDALVTEIASKIDMMPKWVREFVREDIADFDDGCDCEHENGA